MHSFDDSAQAPIIMAFRLTTKTKVLDNNATIVNNRATKRDADKTKSVQSK